MAIISALKEEEYEIHYIGSLNGIEKELVSHLEGVKYYPIATGKLRRFLSIMNVVDSFRVILGIIQSWSLLEKLKPEVVFSNGGYVSFPAVFASKLLGIRSFIHESDKTMGLANRLSAPFATKIFSTFDLEGNYSTSNKVEKVGPILRHEFYSTPRIAREHNEKRKTIAFIGGSQGASVINDFVHGNLELLLNTFNVIHICGKGKLNGRLNQTNYEQYEYLQDDYLEVLNRADIVISRAGSNAIFEFLYLCKPMILIPLGINQSRGDQLINAKQFEKDGIAVVIEEELLEYEVFYEKIKHVNRNYSDYVSKMLKIDFVDGLERMIDAVTR